MKNGVEWMEARRHIRCKWRCLLLAAAVMTGLLQSVPAPAQSHADEYRVKAAFIFHFAQLVEWPAAMPKNGDGSFGVCVLGDDPFHGALEESMNGKAIGDRPIRVAHPKQAGELQGCQILFLPAGEARQFPSVLNDMKDTPILTIGDSEEFVLQQGGMIGFLLENNKIRFDINLDATNRAKMKISSRLLLLAKIVIGNQGQK